jgi:hypothetical protein
MSLYNQTLVIPRRQQDIRSHVLGNDETMVVATMAVRWAHVPL